MTPHQPDDAQRARDGAAVSRSVVASPSPRLDQGLRRKLASESRRTVLRAGRSGEPSSAGPSPDGCGSSPRSCDLGDFALFEGADPAIRRPTVLAPRYPSPVRRLRPLSDRSLSGGPVVRSPARSAPVPFDNPRLTPNADGCNAAAERACDQMSITPVDRLGISFCRTVIPQGLARAADVDHMFRGLLPCVAGEGDHAQHGGGGRPTRNARRAPPTAFGGPPSPLRGAGETSLTPPASPPAPANLPRRRRGRRGSGRGRPWSGRNAAGP